MSTRKASIMLRGNFNHEQYRRLCDALDGVGNVYNSMCTMESKTTVVLISLHTCIDSTEMEIVVRNILGQEESLELKIHLEDAHAAA